MTGKASTWLKCQICGFDSKTIQGLSVHITIAHGMTAWDYYVTHPSALRARIKANITKKKCGFKTQCWNFKGRPTSSKGYRTMKIRGAPTAAVHRLSMFAFKGKLPPKNKLALHVCDNPSCCHPEHLSEGTHRQNMEEMSARGRGPGVLTNDDVHLARERKVWGWCNSSIADFLQVSVPVVRRLLLGHTYTHVPYKLEDEIPF